MLRRIAQRKPSGRTIFSRETRQKIVFHKTSNNAKGKTTKDKPRQDKHKARQDNHKARQDETRQITRLSQDKTRQDKERQDKTRQDSRHKTIQRKTTQDINIEHRYRHGHKRDETRKTRGIKSSRYDTQATCKSYKLSRWIGQHRQLHCMGYSTETQVRVRVRIRVKVKVR